MLTVVVLSAQMVERGCTMYWCKYLLFCINAHCFHVPVLRCFQTVMFSHFKGRDCGIFGSQVDCLLPLLTCWRNTTDFSCKNHLFCWTVTVGKLLQELFFKMCFQDFALICEFFKSTCSGCTNFLNSQISDWLGFLPDFL